MEYQKIRSFLGTTSDNVSKFITKKWIEVHDQSGKTEDKYNPSKQIRFKTSMLRSDLSDFSDAYIVVKGTIQTMNTLIMLITLILYCLGTNWLNIAIIIQTLQEVYGSLKETNKIWTMKTLQMLLQMIQNSCSTKVFEQSFYIIRNAID